MIDSRELDRPRDNVIWAYHHILRRPPESQQHIDGWTVLNLSFIDIARHFVNCGEFEMLPPSQKAAAFAKLRQRLGLKPQDDIRLILSMKPGAPLSPSAGRKPDEPS